MSKDPPTMYAFVTDGIYVGNISSFKDLKFLANADISAIINLSGIHDESIEDVDIFEFLLADQELLPMEFPKTKNKLEMIAQCIHDLRNNHRTVLVHCIDGKNKCMLAVGYYLITRCAQSHAVVINNLERLYFSDQQKLDESKELYNTISDPDVIEKRESLMSLVDRDAMKLKRIERRNIRCLTMASFRKLLRIVGGDKK